MQKLADPQLLRTLMQRTGTGASMSVRELAAAVGVPHGTIGNLLTGEQSTAPYDTAQAIATAIGVDVLILFVPVRRATPAQSEAVSA